MIIELSVHLHSTCIVVGSRCHNNIGIEGIVIQETQNTFRLVNSKDKLLSEFKKKVIE